MRLASIFLTTGWCGLIMAALMLLPALWALVIFDFLSAATFSLTSLIVFFISGAMIFSARGVAAQNVRKSELYLLAPVAYIILGVLGSLPLISKTGGLDFAAAFFETVSGLTTTGASVYANPEYETESVLLWRAILGWFGGLLILTFAATIIMPFSIGGVKIKATLIRQKEEESLPQRMRRALKLVALPYIGVTLGGIILLILTGQAFFEACFLTLSTISTTGFVSALSPLTEYASTLSIFVLNGLMLFGMLAFPLHYAFIQGRWRTIAKEPESKGALIMLGVTFVLIASAMPDWSISEKLSGAISIVTTTALAIHPAQASGAGLSLLVYFMPIAIGGMALSTSGGIKLLRMIVLMRHLWQQMSLLPYQHAVAYFKFGERQIKKKQLKEIWNFFILCLVMFALVLLGNSFFFTDFELIWLATLASLSNAGGLAIMSGYPDLYQNMSSFGHIFLAFVMIAGRLELLIVLVLINPAYWRSGN